MESIGKILQKSKDDKIATGVLVAVFRTQIARLVVAVILSSEHL